MIDWGQWRENPALVDAVVVIACVYALVSGPLRSRAAVKPVWPSSAVIRFYAGLALVYLSVGSPIARVGGLYLFSVHVGLQLVILFGASALMLRGFPPWFVEKIFAFAPVRVGAALLLRPVVCGLLFTLVVSVWYVPRLFEWAIGSAAGRVVEQGSLLLAGFLFWWPLASPSSRFPALRFGGRLLYLFALEVALTAVFSYVLMAEHPIYPTFNLAPRLIAGLDAESDQILGGILLASISSLVLVGSLGANFFKWARASERR